MNKRLLFAIAVVLELVIGGFLSIIPVYRNNSSPTTPIIDITENSPLASPLLHSATHFIGYYVIGLINTFFGGSTVIAVSIAMTSYTELIQYIVKPEGRYC